MLYAVLFIFLVYFPLMLLLIAGWYKAMHSPEKRHSTDVPWRPELTVIVPFRNEAWNLPTLISALADQTCKSFRVLLVNDNSTDNSLEVAETLTRDLSAFTVLSSSGVGKKAALLTGINHADTDVIVTTDADCFFSKDWLLPFQKCFSDDKIHFAFGMVVANEEKGMFSRMSALEFLSVVGTGVSAHALGYPMYCNGANLGFRKKSFELVGGYTDNMTIPSGDDEFLFRKMSEHFPAGTKFLNSASSVVSTNLPQQLDGFIQQRLRWAGKWRYVRNRVSTFIGVFALLMQCAVFVALYSLITDFEQKISLFLLGGKVVFDFVFLFVVSRSVNQRLHLGPFFLLEIFHPLYITGIAVFSQFSAYKWKGRRWSSKT